jgi:hypothetical protein
MISNDPATCTASFPRPIARDKDTLKRAVDGLTLGGIGDPLRGLGSELINFYALTIQS